MTLLFVWLHAKIYKGMKKYLPKLIFLIPLLILLFWLEFTLFKPGYIYHTDVTEGLNVEHIQDRYLYTYSDDIGQALAEKARIPLLFLILGIYKLYNITLNLDPSYFVKVKIIFLVISNFSVMFFSTRALLRKWLDERSIVQEKNLLEVASAMAALLYATNYWQTNRIMHFGLFFTTLTIPIFFYLLSDYLFFQNTRSYKVLLIPITLAILTATPHAILIEVLIFLGITIPFLLSKEITKLTKLKKLGMLSLMGILYVIVNLYWIFPFVGSREVPDAALTESIVNIIGEEATLNNSVRLMGYWLTDNAQYFAKTIETPQKIISYMPLLLTIIAGIMLLRHRNYGLFGIIFTTLILGIFLSTSTTLTNMFYFPLMFQSPFSSLGWLFREYDKFGIIIAYIYSLTPALLLIKFIKNKSLSILITLIITAILINYSFFMQRTLSEKYAPVRIPGDFEQVNVSLKEDATEFNTLWYPGSPKPLWANNEEVRYTFSNLISSKPTITKNSQIFNLLEFLFNEDNLENIKMGTVLSKFGVKYLVIRNDESLLDTRIKDTLSKDTTLEKVKETKYLTVFKNISFSDISKFYEFSTITTQGLNAYTNIDENEYLGFSDKTSEIEDTLTPKRIEMEIDEGLDIILKDYRSNFMFPAKHVFIKEEGREAGWTVGSMENINHLEMNYYFEQLGLSPTQFDYDGGIIFARDGYEQKNKGNGKTLPISFSEYPNINLQLNSIMISNSNVSNTSHWNIYRSDLISTDGINALKVTIDNSIPSTLVPHFKVTFKDANGNVEGIKVLYPEYRNSVEQVIKVKDNYEFFELSIWMLPSTERTWEFIGNIRVEDVTNNVQNPTLVMPIETTCNSNCMVFMRAMESEYGGNIKTSIGDKTFYTNTANTEQKHSEGRLKWYFIEKLSNIQGSNLTLESLDGINTINAIAIVDEGSLLQTKVYYEDKIRYLEETKAEEVTKSPAEIITTRINPTKFMVEVKNSDNKKGVLVFARPFNNSWTLTTPNGEILDAERAEGFITGWKIEQLSNGQYIVEYRSQKLFLMGALISAIGFAGLTMIVLWSYRRNRL